MSGLFPPIPGVHADAAQEPAATRAAAAPPRQYAAAPAEISAKEMSVGVHP